MSYIGATPAESYASFYVQHFTTSATTSYSLDYPVVNENDLRLVINNVVQQPGSGYSYTAAASTLTLSAATTTSDTMYAVFLGRALQTVNPPGDSVGVSQLADTVISGQTALGAEPADTDEFMVSDAGVLKRVDYSYIKAPAGGAWTLIERQSQGAGTVSEIQFDGVFSTSYEWYKIFIAGGMATTTGADPIMRLLVGTTAQTGTYNTYNITGTNGPAQGVDSDTQSQTTGWMLASTYNMTYSSSPDTKKRYYHDITIYDPYQTDRYIAMQCNTFGWDREGSGTGYKLVVQGFGGYPTATAFNASIPIAVF